VNREELIEAGAQAMHDTFHRGAVTNREYAAALLDAVEPLIRADERERTNTVGGHRQIRDEGRADMCADLRARVEALRWPDLTKAHVAWNEALDAVLTLIDGSGE
jgi:hypothetical protein